MEIKFDKKNSYEYAILALKELIKGSKFENHVYLSECSARDKIIGKELSDIMLVVNLPNGGVNLAEYITKKTNSYNEDDNPILCNCNQSALFTIRSDSRLENIDFFASQSMKNFPQDNVSITANHGTLLEDATLKETTIDALYINISNGIVLDPTFNGLQDLRECLIRTPSEPIKYLKENPLKILSIVYLSTLFGWGIDKDTWVGMVLNAQGLKEFDLYNFEEEFTNILLCDKPSIGLEKLYRCGALKYILSDIHDMANVMQEDGYSVFEHTKKVIDLVPCTKNIRWAALLHDIGKPFTKTSKEGRIYFSSHEFCGATLASKLLTALGFKSTDKDIIVNTIKNHMRFKCYYSKCPTARVVRRILSDIGMSSMNVLLEVVDADNKVNEPSGECDEQINKVKKLLKSILESEKEKNKPKLILPINGNDIMKQFKIKSGPQIGRLMKFIQGVCEKKPSLTKEEAFALIEEMQYA